MYFFLVSVSLSFVACLRVCVLIRVFVWLVGSFKNAFVCLWLCLCRCLCLSVCVTAFCVSFCVFIFASVCLVCFADVHLIAPGHTLGSGDAAQSA